MKTFAFTWTLGACLALILAAGLAGGAAWGDVIATGANHSLYLADRGDLWAFGSNNYGQLGNGSLTYDPGAGPVKTATNVVDVNAGRMHTLYVTGSGELYAVGANEFGQSGVDPALTSVVTTPVKVADNVVAISLGGGHSLYITTSGELFAFGRNDYGQLGDGTLTNRWKPVKIANHVAVVASGWGHSLYITADGEMFAMGYNSYGQLGDGTTLNQSTPVKIADDVVAVAGGEQHSLFLTTSGELWGVGNNQAGQLGDGTADHRRAIDKIADDVAFIAAGGNSSFYITTGGQLYATGANNYGQLGVGSTANQFSPAAVAENVIFVRTEGRHSLYLTADGMLFGMGRNSFGQLGVVAATVSSTPVQVPVVAPVASPFTPLVYSTDNASEQPPGGVFTLRVSWPRCYPQPTYQWYANGQPIAGATQRSLKRTMDAATSYQCAVTFGTHTYLSAEKRISLRRPLLFNGLQAPSTDVPGPETTSYTAILYNNEQIVCGMLTLTAQTTLKKGATSGTVLAGKIDDTIEPIYTTLADNPLKRKITAKLTLRNGTVHFTAKAWTPLEGYLLLTKKGGETLQVRVRKDRITGSVFGGKVDGILTARGVRDTTKRQEDEVSRTHIAALEGFYTSTLINADVEQQLGYLTLKVGSLGQVSVAGRMANGAAFSCGGKVLDGLNNNGWQAIAFHKTLYASKKPTELWIKALEIFLPIFRPLQETEGRHTSRGALSGLLWVNPQDKVLRTDRGYGWYVHWGVDKQDEHLSNAMDICGGYFSDGKTAPKLLNAYSFDVELPASEALPVPSNDMAGGAWSSAAFPQGMPVLVSGPNHDRLSLPHAVAPRKVGSGSEAHYNYAASPNPSCSTLSYNPKTGVFKGKFKLYYDAHNTRGKLHHKTLSVPYAGILSPLRDAAFDDLSSGLGSAIIPIGQQKIAVPVDLDATGW